MGNWMTVNIEGTIDPNEVQPLIDWLTIDYTAEESAYKNYGALSIYTTHGLFGLGVWPAPTVFATGNCAERDFTPETVAEHLTRMLEVAPSMNLKVHCGGDYESTDCVATVVVENGTVTVNPPERPQVAPPSMDAAMGRLFQNLQGR